MNWKNCLARQRKEDKYDDKFGFVGMMEMKLNEICEVYSGYALKKFNDGEDGIPVIKIGNIRIDGTLNLETCQYTTEGVDKKYYSNRGDVYIALSGATTGKVGIMDTDDLYVINQRVGIVRQKTDDIPQEYIKNFLLRQTDRILKEATGCAQPNISPKQIAEYIVPDISKEKMYEICVIFNKIKKIINDRNAEISALDNLIKARFVEMFGGGLKNDGKFKMKAISEIGRVVSGATPKTSNENYWDGDNLWITPAEVSDKSFIVYDSIRKITDDGVKSCALNLLPTGTVILSSRAPIGKVAIVGKAMYCNQGFKNIIPDKNINSIYLYTLLNMEKEYLNSLGRGATFKEISKQIVENIKIKVPPIELQNQFADFVHQVDKSKFVYY